jgi:nickel-dependent lactate racemase
MSQSVQVPYGDGSVAIGVPGDAIVLEVADQPAPSNPVTAVKEALGNPLGCDKLSQIACKGGRAAVVVPDVTRPGNFRQIAASVVLEELHAAGVKDSDIVIVNGPGSHRMNTPDELRKMLGAEICSRYRVVNHDLYDNDNLVDFGTSELGDPVVINRTVAEADIIVDLGLVQPQPSAGYSSGGKHFAVGVAGAQTIVATHRSFDPDGIWGPTSRIGVWKGNRFRDRLESIAQTFQEKCKAGVIFTVNCVINSRHQIIGVFAGEMMASFTPAAELADRQWKVDITRQADIVVCAAGYPYDKDIYQVGVATCTLERAPIPVVKEGGVIIFVGPMDEISPEGTTEAYVTKVLLDSYSPEDVFQKAQEFDDKGEIPPLGLQRAFSNCLFEKLVHGNLFIAGAKRPGFTRGVHWMPTRDFDTAFQMGKDLLGNSNVEVVVVPRARSTIVNVTGRCE